MSGSSTASAAQQSAPAFVNPDFPTAAEAAAFKRAQEEKERQEAAEAASRHEQYMKNLDRFRGTAIGSGRHWDELDDEDGGFLDEVVEFADGTQYKIPAQPHQKESEVTASEGVAGPTSSSGPPVSKEERFRDVDHDRSWPMKSPSGEQASAQTTPPSQPPVPHRRTVVRETLDISSGAPSISLDDAVSSRSLFDPLRGARYSAGTGGPTSMRKYEDSLLPSFTQRRDSRGASEQPAVDHTAARAWGPLAQRQASLNPNAPKSTATASQQQNQPSIQQTSLQTAVTSSHSSTTAPLSTPAPTADKALSASEKPRHVDSTSQDASSQPHLSGRPLPPHLALQQQRTLETFSSSSTVLAPPPARDVIKEQPTIIAPAVPVAPWIRAEKASAVPFAHAPASAKEQESGSKTTAASAAVQATTGPSERDEMLSAVERARRRRQEEELLRAAERERAKQKALAIEEKMRKDAEEKAAAELRAKEEADQARRKEQEKATAAAEESRRKEAEARAELWRPKNSKGALKSHVVSPNLARSTSYEKGSQRSGVGKEAARHARGEMQQPLSPSDEATSWRRQAPLPTSSLSSTRKPYQTTLENTPSTPSVSPQLLRRSQPGSISESLPGLKAVVDRVRTENVLTLPRAQRHDNESITVPQSPEILSKFSGPLDACDTKISPSDAFATARAALPATSVPHTNLQSDSASRTAPPVIRRFVAAEPILTRESPPEDQRPVWNKFKVKLNPSMAKLAVPRFFVKAQKGRIAASHQYENLSATKSPNILTWDPPIPTLSARTLSRDDEFFKKRFNKGKVITPVKLPTKCSVLGRAAKLSIRPDRLNNTGSRSAVRELFGRGVAVKLPAQTRKEDADMDSDFTGLAPSVPSIPTAPASMRAKTASLSSIARAEGNPALASPSVRRHFLAVVDPTSSSSMTGGIENFDYSHQRIAHQPRAQHSDLELSSRPELDFGLSNDPANAGWAAPAGSGGSLAFSQRAAVGSGRVVSTKWRTGARSPVFMVQSELDTQASNVEMPDSSKESNVRGPERNNLAGSAALSGVPISPVTNNAAPSSSSTTPSRNQSAVATPLLSSTGLGTSTWGHGSLSFLDSNGGSSSQGQPQRGYQDVWGRPSHSASAPGQAAMMLARSSNAAGDSGSSLDPLSLRDMGADTAVHESLLPSTLLNDDVIDSGDTGTGQGHQSRLAEAGSQVSRAINGGGSRSAPNASPNLLRSPEMHLSVPSVGDQAPHYGRPGSSHHASQHRHHSPYSHMQSPSPYYQHSASAYDRGQHQYPSQYVDAAMGPRGNYGRSGPPLSSAANVTPYGGYGVSLSSQAPPRRHNPYAQQQARTSAVFGPSVGPADGPYGTAAGLQDDFHPQIQANSQHPASGTQQYGTSIGLSNKMDNVGSTWSVEQETVSSHVSRSYNSLPAASATSSHSSANASRMPFARTSASASSSSAASSSSPSAGHAQGTPYGQYHQHHQPFSGKDGGYSPMRHTLSSGTKLNADASAFQHRNPSGSASHQAHVAYSSSQRSAGRLGALDGGPDGSRGGEVHDAGSGAKTPRQQSQETAAALWS